MYEVIGVYKTIHSYMTHGLMEVHRPVMESNHDSTFQSAKELAIKCNEYVKEKPEALFCGEFFYVRSVKTQSSIDVGSGVGDLGYKHKAWTESQKIGHQFELFGSSFSDDLDKITAARFEPVEYQ